MKVVLDTNVVAYHLLGAPETVRTLSKTMRKISSACAPALIEAELANVVWRSVTSGALTRDLALKKLEWARALPFERVACSTLWRGALVRAISTRHSMYDVLFVELAVRRNLPLLTFDQELIRHFPTVAVDPSTVE
ncbi:MAG: type II toxin-antitoxin system VapC family toxin [Deltaproteobacteria bacterium]|nr:type II toxin-antitoxin system VapC family toxin [Deltaproteobacteria bacterium]